MKNTIAQTPRLFRIIAVFLGFALPYSAQGNVIYQISADTTVIRGTTGYLDLQFNPGGAGTLASTATISRFHTDATGLSLSTTDGDVSGTLVPGPLAINNTSALNDVMENITFGANIAFTLTLSGPEVTSPNPSLPESSFGLSFYDSNFDSLLTTDAAGTVVTINVNSDGSTSPEMFSSDGAGGAPVGNAVVQSSAVPEPSTIVLLAIAVFGLVAHGVANRWQHSVIWSRRSK